MRSIPYGYRIVEGKAIADAEESKKIVAAFERYAAGDSLRKISEDLGIGRYHRGMALILTDEKYLGTEFYPQIIDKALFEKVQKIRAKRKEQHARPPRAKEAEKPATRFVLRPGTKHLSDPFAQAQYIYGRIKIRSEDNE
ncbi:MAG: hypothetical protein ACI4ET_06540 [Bilifractor sp.]